VRVAICEQASSTISGGSSMEAIKGPVAPPGVDDHRLLLAGDKITRVEAL
jgi:hypothetical protein